MKKRLLKFFDLSRRVKGGFTLVELVVVIAILGVLAGIAIPTYSGYMKKADKAADEQLLAAVNKAFVSACIENGEDSFGRNDVVASGDAGSDFTYTAPFADDFNTLFEGGKFKVMSVVYNDAAGCFVEKSDSDFSSLAASLKDKFGEDIANKILTSTLGSIGTETLFEKMNGVMDDAANLGLAQAGGAAFMAAYLQYMGINLDDYDTTDDAQAALDAKLESLGVDAATSENNALALYAAQNSGNLSIDDLSEWLGSGNTTEAFEQNASGNTLAEAAAIYGLYLSYCQETNGTTPSDPALQVMNNALGDNDFAIWVKDAEGGAQAELDAYKTYMAMINEAGKDDSARDEIMANGFSNPELEKLMKDIIGS